MLLVPMNRAVILVIVNSFVDSIKIVPIVAYKSTILRGFSNVV